MLFGKKLLAITMITIALQPAQVLALVPQGPSFSCAMPRTTIEQTICRDRSSWPADWAMVAAYYASLWSIQEPERARLRADHLAWFKGVQKTCNVEGTGQPPPGAGACVSQQYRERAAFYKRSLRGDAAAEADLPPIDLFAIQNALLEQGLARKEPDGIFNGGTRQAISAFRQTRGRPPADFLSAQDRDELLHAQARSPMAGPARSDYQRGGQPPFPLPPGPLGQIFGEIVGRQPGAFRPDRRPYDEQRDRQDRFANDPYSDRYDSPARRKPDNDAARRSDFDSPPRMPERELAPRPEKSLASEFSDSGSAVVSKPLGTGGTANVGGTTPEPAERTVQVVGSGETADEARKDATRLAVQQVAGVFIDNRRRVELNVSDNKVSEVVQEKILSYTNAFVSKFDIVKSEKKSDAYEVTANVSVAVKPLLKTLQENQLPTVAFDSASASATAQSMGEEKASATAFYVDLLHKVPDLIRVGVGSPNVDPNIPSTANEAWLRVPLTFNVNDEAAREWQSKLSRISQERKSLELETNGRGRSRSDPECAIPSLSTALYGNNAWSTSFLGRRPTAGNYGFAACFAPYETSSGIALECYGRAFIADDNPTFRGRCSGKSDCLSFQQAADHIDLVVEFLDRDKNVVFSSRQDLPNFPSLPYNISKKAPNLREKSFMNFCIDQNRLFFTNLSRNGGLLTSQFGDVVVFPPKGNKAYAYYNVLVPNGLIDRIAEVRAKIEKSS